MSRALTIAFILISTLAAALFVRLGVWQLTRLGERRMFNALIASRLDSAVVPFERMPRDAQQARFRRVRIAGTWDLARELVVTGKSRNGSPGVHLLTPVRLEGSDTAILVNRGWVYSPDGAQVDRLRWRPRGDSALVEGFAVSLPPALPKATSPGLPPVVRWIELPQFRRWAGYPVHAFQVVQQGDTARAHPDSTPARLTPPTLDEGPHQGYAFQWFAFATIALIGVPVFVLTRGREREKAGRVPPAPEREAP